jgi:hypothetical protein
MIYSRGAAAEYDAWAAKGHPKWGYEKVLPYFVKSENSLSTPKSRYRGKKGEPSFMKPLNGLRILWSQVLGSTKQFLISIGRSGSVDCEYSLVKLRNKNDLKVGFGIAVWRWGFLEFPT